MNNENTIDTLLDIAGYALIGYAMSDNAWGEFADGIHSPLYRSDFYAKLDRLFASKLQAYGTKDLSSVGQITQRIKEKALRIENLVGNKSDSYKLQVKKHNSEGGIIPPQKEGDAGLDLIVSEDVVVPPFGEKPISVPCGFGVKLPEGYWAEIRPRSSTSTKLGIFVHQSVMDCGYTGPWFIVAHSLLKEPIKIEKGTRLAQCILHKINNCEIIEVNELPTTNRGSAGFGSTGIKRQ